VRRGVTNEHLPPANKTDPPLPESEASGAPWRNQRTFASGKRNRSLLAGGKGSAVLRPPPCCGTGGGLGLGLVI
jgi:hypothetical protein